ncbi:hypothetical protein AMJ47_01045 [Parcubacteria bacterium DG_72]|nr:MAG: hypothetical protein AMJ47_01045 [Parcubacteria bacterium DG_72]
MNGYIALMSVLVILAVILAAAIGASFLSISEAGMGLGKDQSSSAYYLASACAEEALQQINGSLDFQGSGAVSFSNGDCSYEVIVGSGQDRTIRASGIVADVVRKIIISVDQVVPIINIASWQEVADF